MNKFINSNIGLLFVLTMLVCAAGVEQMEFEKQVGSKSAEFFKKEFCVDQFTQGQQDCRNHEQPQSADAHYQSGWKFEETVQEVRAERSMK